MPDDILLMFCDLNWECKGVIAFKSIEAAKAKAEIGYKGISGKWIDAVFSKEEINLYLRDVYQVDPETEWWKVCCSFCGKEDAVVTRMLASNSAKICNECVMEFHRFITKA